MQAHSTNAKIESLGSKPYNTTAAAPLLERNRLCSFRVQKWLPSASRIPRKVGHEPETDPFPGEHTTLFLSVYSSTFIPRRIWLPNNAALDCSHMRDLGLRTARHRSCRANPSDAEGLCNRRDCLSLRGRSVYSDNAAHAAFVERILRVDNDVWQRAVSPRTLQKNG